MRYRPDRHSGAPVCAVAMSLVCAAVVTRCPGPARAQDPGQLLEDLLFVVSRPVFEIVLEQQHFLADVPLDRQPVRGDGLHNPSHRRRKRPLVSRNICLPGTAADVHVGCGHGRGNADLEPYVRWYYTLIL